MAPAFFGYIALLVGSYAAWALIRIGHQPLGVALFILLFVYGTGLVLLSALATTVTADKLRFLSFALGLAVYAGIFGGSAWVLWFHGNPARVVPW